MRIVFMGTPDFAVASLQALIDNNHDVCGVFTQPDKPKGRGKKLAFPPVKEVALKNNINVFQPNSLKTDEAYNELKRLNPDIIIVVAYGKILPKNILDLPRYGCVNVHASILPKYRGAGPIQWSVLNGETHTGVTTMYMAEGLDTGDMLLKSEIAIGENETASELHDRLSILGADVLINTINGIEGNNITPIKQDDSQSSYAPMLSKELCEIDYSKPAIEVHNQIRGLSTWPCATTKIQGQRLKVYKSEIVSGQDGAIPGQVLCNKTLIVACANSTAIRFIEIQLDGSKRMASQDFLRGKNVNINEILG